MNRKNTTSFALVCIAAAMGAVGFVAYRILAENAAGRAAAKADFEGLRSVLAYVKSPSDLADPGLRARLASRYEASPALLLVEVYERGDGDRWRIPADSPYLAGLGKAGGSPAPSYPPASTILLSAPLKGDSSGKLAVDALYVTLPQASAFGVFRDALIGLGAFLALAALILAIISGREGSRKSEAKLGFAEDSDAEDEPAEKRESGQTENRAAAAAQYQFETLLSEKELVDELVDEPPEVVLPVEEQPSAEEPPVAEEEFDIPIMDYGLSVKSAPEDLPEPPQPEPPQPEPQESSPQAGGPSGLYSPSSGLGWESYMKERLDAEISRSASFEQDLSLIIIGYDGLSSQDEAYLPICKAIKEFFSFRDLAFERGDDGFSIILPNIDSPHAMRIAEEFNKKLVFLAEGDFAELELLPIYMGISSRAGRLVNADRLAGEAEAALDRATYEKESHIVAFRPDPDKYRLFLASRN